MLQSQKYNTTGICWYAGIPGAGKTTRAIEEARTISSATGRPILAIDPARVEQFTGSDWQRAKTVDECIALTWKDGRHTVFTPNDEMEAEAIFGAVNEAGGVVLLIDEAHYYLSAHYLSPNLSKIMRAYRHLKLKIILTTQNFGDIPQRALGQAPHLYIGRQTAPLVLDRLEKQYGLDPQKIRNIPKYEFVHFFDGFSS